MVNLVESAVLLAASIVVLCGVGGFNEGPFSPMGHKLRYHLKLPPVRRVRRVVRCGGCCDVVWLAVVWYDVVWYDVVWLGVVW